MNVSWVEIQSDFYVSLMLPLSCIYGWRREEECFITFLTVRSALMVSLFPIKQTPLWLKCQKIILKYLTWNLFIIDGSSPVKWPGGCKAGFSFGHLFHIARFRKCRKIEFFFHEFWFFSLEFWFFSPWVFSFFLMFLVSSLEFEPKYKS